jgi:death on curing protein
MDELAYSLADLVVMHELLVARFGGMRGITEQGFGKLEAALAAPYASMFGDELYPGMLTKAAVLFFRLARSHGFSDGNKRVALVALVDFLDQNGIRLAATEDELYDFVMAAATDGTQDEVEAWLAARIEMAAHQ